MKKTMFSRGFTLIELLVVIAIIGILAAVVLASLNDARDSGNDAAIKQSLGNIRSQAEIVYNQDNFSYAAVCDDSKVDSLEAAVDSSNGAGTMFCNDAAESWVAASTLVSTTSSWCVDSTGFAGIVTTAPSGTDLVCP